MRIFGGLDAPGLVRTPRVLAVGAFDGVHRGHRRLLGHVCRIATEYGVESAVMTFEPIPAQVFRPEGPNNIRLTPAPERDRELRRECVDTAIVVPFDEEFRAMSAYDFARNVLVERLGVAVLVASKTHSFGRNAEADVQRITELGMELGFEVHVLPPILVGDQQISSSEIRKRLWAGDVENAALWLGRAYELCGLVEPGRGLGRELGFPTANLRPAPEKLVPGDGVYACAGRIEDAGTPRSDWMPAAVSIGRTPTVGEGPRLIEAHLLDGDFGDLSGLSVRLLFLRRLRDQRRFPHTDALVRQIHNDVSATQEIFAARSGAICARDWTVATDLSLPA